jgi:hypothetical protein
MAKAKKTDTATEPDATDALDPAVEQAQSASDVSAAADVVDGKSADALAAIEKQFDASPQSVDVLFPPPAGIPASVLEGAHLVVKAMTSKGRWRAGRHLTRDETLIPLAEVSDEQQRALLGDPKIDVKLRLFKPAENERRARRPRRSSGLRRPGCGAAG